MVKVMVSGWFFLLLQKKLNQIVIKVYLRNLKIRFILYLLYKKINKELLILSKITPDHFVREKSII